MLLRARCIYPVIGSPIEDGYVRINGERIAEVGPWCDCVNRGGVENLGEVVLMPGLVNTHCHLDYTDFVGAIPPPDSFTGWIQAIVDLKADVDKVTHRESWLRGARQAAVHGITTIGNIETRCDLLPDLWRSTPLRIVSFIESILFKAGKDASETVVGLRDWLLGNQPPRGGVGVSPHAPYTTKLEFLQECGKLLDVPLAMHVAESSEEDQMFRDGKGIMWEMFRNSGRDMSDCGNISPLAGARQTGLLSERMLLVHGNYLDSSDIAAIAHSQASMVHCPRSHDYFGHRSFPAKAMQDTGVNLCLGTDSLATMRDPDAKVELFSELQLFRKKYPEWKNEDMIEMVTLNAARALGMHGQIGCVCPGANADLIALPFDSEINAVEEVVIEHRGPVTAVMIGGEWVEGIE